MTFISIGVFYSYPILDVHFNLESKLLFVFFLVLTGSIQKGWLEKKHISVLTPTNQYVEHESLIMVMLMEKSFYMVFEGT